MKIFSTATVKSLFILFVFASCNSGKYQLVFQPAHDTEYQLMLKMGGKVGMNLLGKDMNTEMNTTIISRLHFDTLPNRKTSVAFGYEDYTMGQQVGDVRINMDSTTSQGDSVSAHIKDMLKHIKFNAVMNAQGKMESKVPTDSLWKKIEASLAPLEETVRTQLAAALKPLINDDMMVGLVEQCFYILPKTKVDVGDKWRNQLKMTSLFSMIINNEFELISVNNGVAEIAVHATITNTDKQGALPGLAMAGSPLLGQPDTQKGFDLMGIKMEATFTGTQDGVLFVDMGTGIMQSAKMNQLLDGKFKINTMELPMKLNMKNEYSCKKM